MTSNVSRLSLEAKRRLAGQWGSYDFHIISERHFVTASDVVERFLEAFKDRWEVSEITEDRELVSSIAEVRSLLEEWAPSRIQRFNQAESIDTVRAHIMFKQLVYGRHYTISFGAIGTNWKKKSEIAQELSLYRPWSVGHAVATLGSRAALYEHVRRIVEQSKSPTESLLFDSWWALSEDDDRPMLFPQVQGHTSGKFWLETPRGTKPIHFDFGFVNVRTKRKVLIECDSRRYHSKDAAYQADRTRQNVAEREGWSVRRFTYEDVTQRLDYCFDSLAPDIEA